jgi:hypothetical protein
MISPVSEWPIWLVIVVFAPHAILMGILTWVWLPKTNKDWRRFGIVFAYLVVFYLVMYYVFHFR